MKKRNKIICIVAGSILCAAFGVIYWQERASTILLKEIERKLETVELGMSREQVRSIVGDPTDILSYDAVRGLKKEYWYFSRDPATASDPLCCVFDSDTGEVIEIIIYTKRKTAESLIKWREARNK